MLSDFEKEKVYWTRKMNLKLVHFMKSKPHIWNPRHPQYTSAKLKHQTYGQFAAMYKYQFSGQAVKERWRNIRSTFASYLRKVNKAAEGESEVYQVNWPLWDSLQYLLKAKGAKNDRATSDFAESSSAGEDDLNTVTELDHQSDENNVMQCNTIANDLVNVFKGMQNDAFGLDNSKNAKIGRTVTERLSQMNSHDAAKVSVQIMEVLLKYEVKNSSDSSFENSQVYF